MLPISIPPNNVSSISQPSRMKVIITLLRIAQTPLDVRQRYSVCTAALHFCTYGHHQSFQIEQCTHARTGPWELPGGEDEILPKEMVRLMPDSRFWRIKSIGNGTKIHFFPYRFLGLHSTLPHFGSVWLSSAGDDDPLFPFRPFRNVDPSLTGPDPATKVYNFEQHFN